MKPVWTWRKAYRASEAVWRPFLAAQWICITVRVTMQHCPCVLCPLLIATAVCVAMCVLACDYKMMEHEQRLMSLNMRRQPSTDNWHHWEKKSQFSEPVCQPGIDWTRGQSLKLLSYVNGRVSLLGLAFTTPVIRFAIGKHRGRKLRSTVFPFAMSESNWIWPTLTFVLHSAIIFNFIIGALLHAASLFRSVCLHLQTHSRLNACIFCVFSLISVVLFFTTKRSFCKQNTNSIGRHKHPGESNIDSLLPTFYFQFVFIFLALFDL